MTLRSTAIVALALICAGIGLLVDAGRPREAAAGTYACTRAVMVDGFLRCDEEAPREVAALCSEDGPRAAAALCSEGGPRSNALIEAGDAIDTSKVCALEVVRRGRAEHGWTRMDPEDLRILEQPVDVNHASLQELASLPGVGPIIAERIVDGRPYETVEALRRVKGIGPVRLEGLRARARVPHTGV